MILEATDYEQFAAWFVHGGWLLIIIVILILIAFGMMLRGR